MSRPSAQRMCSGCIVNNSVVNIAYQFEPDWDAEDISEEDRAEPVWSTALNGMFVFSRFILLNTLLFVNATASVSF